MRQKVYYVYILASRSRALYTGVTNNLARRVVEHRQGKVPGFTHKYKIHRLVYYEEFRDVRSAIGRETQVKAWRREKRVGLIEETNPAWSDLAASWFGPPRTKADSSSLRSSE
jgi:putative endonuclease